MPKKKVALVNIEGLASQEDVKTLMINIISAVRGIQTQLRSHLDTKGNEWSTGFQKFNSRLEKAMLDFEQLKKSVESLPDELIRLRDELKDALNDVEGKIPTVNLTPIELKVLELDEMTKKMHEENMMHIKVEDFEKLKKEIVDLREQITRIPRGKATGMKKIVYTRRVNLTTQVDGNTRDFTLPSDTIGVLGLFGTQFPITFDTADWNVSGRTLTLASGITTPLAGQTLFALVETQFYG